jgi:hypothetical protein
LEKKTAESPFRGDYTNIYWLVADCQTSAAGNVCPGLPVKIMADTEKKIAVDVVKELRMIAHDLSNALEGVVQATYLAKQANPPENTRRWLEVIDKSSQEAARLNQKLREILRSQS